MPRAAHESRPPAAAPLRSLRLLSARRDGAMPPTAQLLPASRVDAAWAKAERGLAAAAQRALPSFLRGAPSGGGDDALLAAYLLLKDAPSGDSLAGGLEAALAEAAATGAALPLVLLRALG
jgi:hypothetical protein